MEITFTGHQIEITPALHEYTQKKFLKLEKHYSKIIHVNVIFNFEKPRSIVEATMQIPGDTIHASAENLDMYVAVNQLVDKLDRQLKKHKEKETEQS
jgi:putative sigma-54 modulation protein